MSDCSEKGLAMYLSIELLGKRFFTMPQVLRNVGERYGASLL